MCFLRRKDCERECKGQVESNLKTRDESNPMLLDVFGVTTLQMDSMRLE